MKYGMTLLRNLNLDMSSENKKQKLFYHLPAVEYFKVGGLKSMA